MATHRISCLQMVAPDTSGKIWQEPSSILLTTAPWRYMVWRYDEDGSNTTALTTRVGLFFKFPVPQNYSSAANFVVDWTSTVTSGDIEWDIDYRAVGGNDTESYDQSGTQESLNSLDTAPSASDERMELSISATDGNFAAGDTVTGAVYNDGVDAGDTLAGARLLFDLYFEYSD